MHKLLADTLVATLSSPLRNNCVTTTSHSPSPTTARVPYARKYTSPHIGGPNGTKCWKRKYLDAPSLPRTYSSCPVSVLITLLPEHYLSYKLPHPVSRSLRRRNRRPRRCGWCKWQREEVYSKPSACDSGMGKIRESSKKEAAGSDGGIAGVQR